MRHPEVARLRAKTRMLADPELDKGWPEVYVSIVEVKTTGGRSLSCRVDHAKGSMENPLTPEEIHAKYLSLATTVTSAAHAEQIAEIVQRIDRTPDIARFAGLLRSLKSAGSSTKRRAKTGTS
jgi:2-methylcitrate dehydratase PrpD